MEKAKTLWVAVWLHCLDMAAAKGKATSLSLEAAQHGMGPLLEYLLVPKTGSLTLEEIVKRVVMENRQEVEDSLDDLQQCWAQLLRELDALSQTHQRESNRNIKKTLKRELEQKRKDLQGLEVSMSHHQHHL